MKRKHVHRATLQWTRADHTLDVITMIKNDLRLCDRSDLEVATLPSPDPACFTEAESFRFAYWQSEVLSKCPFLKTGLDTKEAAMLSFSEYENMCATSNSRLADLWHRPIPERYRSILRSAKSILADLFKDFSKDEVIRRARWSSGSTTSRSRAWATPQNKWLAVGHITRGALPYFDNFCEYSGWILSEPKLCLGNKVQVVPKNAKTDRTIAVEPDWNMFFQLGLGSYMSSRLQRIGLLREDAKEKNQRLAKCGSLDNFLSTIDVKGASDCVSVALVEALFPPNIVEVMLDLRSPYGEFEDGTVVAYEKISSMGNGFTFEMETALFYALAKAASGNASVFGDDIIVVSTAFQLVSDVLEFCGFTVNRKKSFSTDFFRESCGGHFFKGIDVTPPYVRKRLTGLQLIRFLNRVSAVSEVLNCRSSPLRDTWLRSSLFIPKSLYGPKNVDDTLHASREDCLLSFNRRTFLLHGRRFIVLPDKRKKAPGTGALRHALYGQHVNRASWMKHPDSHERVMVLRRGKPIWWTGLGSFYGPWV